MICKGHARTNGGQLASYLADYLTAEKNDKVRVAEIRGSAFPDLHRSLASWEAETKGSRCRNAIWHAQIAPAANEHLTPEQQIGAVNILEKHLGLQGQPRAIVVHTKHGQEHIHVAWSRFDRKTRTARRDDFTHKRNVAAAAEIAERFGLEKVKPPDFDKTGTRQERRERSKKAPDYGDFQKAKRSGIDPREVTKVVTALWHQSDTGKAFRAALQDAGFTLARGKSRAFVIVDRAGEVHSLARRIADADTAAVKQRFADIDPASIPLAEHVQQQLRRARKDAEPQAENEPKAERATPRTEAIHQTDTRKVEPSPFDKTPRDPHSLDAADILADMTKQKSTFTKGELVYEIRKRVEVKAETEAIDPKEVERTALSVRRHADFITLGPDRTGNPRYTSREMLETELRMRDASDKLAEAPGREVRKELVDAVPELDSLTEQQRQAFDHVISGSHLRIVKGVAGAGKTYLFKRVKKYVNASGDRISGVAPSAMAAKGLQDGSGIKSTTLHGRLWQLENLHKQEAKLAEMDARISAMGQRGIPQRKARADAQTRRDKLAAQIDATRLTSRDVIVLDEAGMVDSRKMEQLLTLAQKAGAKVVLVGDAEQLQSIDAGGAFRALEDRHGSVSLDEVRRQTAPWARQATKDFAQSYTDDALKAYRDRGHVHAVANHAKARDLMVDAWTKVRAEHPEQTQLMMAYSRNDVAELNLAAREAYRAEGRITGVDATISTSDGKRQFATGDRMYFLKNDLRLGVMNGSLGTVEQVQAHGLKDGHRMRVKLDAGATVEFDTADYSNFSHGYAATIHKSQGATVDRAHVLVSQFMDRHATYVAMSRHREQADMYYSYAEFKDYSGLVRKLSRDNRKDTTLDYLDRAEKAGTPEKFWDRVRGVIETLTKEEKRQRAFERLAKAIQLRNDPEARAEAQARRETKEAAARLRQVLGDYPEHKRKKKHEPGISV